MIVKYGYELKNGKWVGYYQAENTEVKDLFNRIKDEINVMYVYSGHNTDYKTMYAWCKSRGWQLIKI